MSHEQSETIEVDGKYILIYGRETPKAGQQLPGTPQFESQQQADEYAHRRSESFNWDHLPVDNVKGNRKETYRMKK